MASSAARVGDQHSCPQVTAPSTPHVGGPVSGPGVATVLIGQMPAVAVGDGAKCNGPQDTIAKGSATVFIAGRPAARLGDTTAHGGRITTGCVNVLIGG